MGSYTLADVADPRPAQASSEPPPNATGGKKTYTLSDVQSPFPIKTGGLQPSTNEQVAGPVPTEEGLMQLAKDAFIPKKNERLEFAGSMANAVARKAGIPGMALAGTGATIGNILEQLREAYTGENPPTSTGESLGRMGAAFGTGAVGEGVSKVIGKIFHPFSGSVANEAARKTAENMGIEPPVSTLTNAKFVQGAERLAEFSPFGQAITKIRDKALAGLRSAADSMGSAIGLDRPSEVTGNMAKQQLGSFKEMYDATKDKIYDAVMPAVKNIPADLSNTIQTLRDIIKRRSGPGEPAGLDMVRGWLKDVLPKQVDTGLVDEAGNPIMKTVPGVISKIGDLRKFKTNIGARGKFGDPATSGLSSDIKMLWGSIAQDIDNGITKVDKVAGQALKSADEFYAQGKGTLKSKVFKAINVVNPENVHKVIIVPNSPSQAALGREILGDDVFGDVTRQWWDSVLQKATDKEGNVVPSKLANGIRRYGSTLPELFKDSPDLLKQLGNLKDVATLLSHGEDVAKGSQTGPIQQVIVPLITAFGTMLASPQKAVGALAGAAGGLAAQYAGTKAIASKAGREYLTRGFPKTGAAAAFAARPGIMIGLQKLKNELESGDNQ